MRPELRINPASGDKLLVRSLLRYLPVFEHNNAVHFPQRREPVRNRDDRLPFHQLAERLLDFHFALTIERRGRLVEQEYRRVFQYCAGNWDALAFAAGELDAALADHRAVAGRKPGDEVVRLRELRRFDDFLFGCARISVCDVLADGAVEEQRLLRHDRDGVAEALLRHARDIGAVNRNRPRTQIMVAQDEPDERGFPRARPADDTDPLPRRDDEREVLEDDVLPIGEARLIE